MNQLEIITEEYRNFPLIANNPIIINHMLSFFKENYLNFDDYMIVFSDFSENKASLLIESEVAIDATINVGDKTVSNREVNRSAIQEKELRIECFAVDTKKKKVTRCKYSDFVANEDVIAIRFVVLSAYKLLFLEKL